MIRIISLKKLYGANANEVVALNNINIEIEKGKFVIIYGKSGCGKSTLLNCIGGLDSATEGSIFVDDVDIAKLNCKDLASYRNKKIGYVFQSFYLEPNFTVCENVEMPLIIAGIDKNIRREKAVKLLASLNLSEKINEKVKNLSGGQKQRVCFARALINDCSYILADEPTGNLDTENGKIVVDLLKEQHKNGKTIIFVTHNMDYLDMADIVINMTDGVIVDKTEKIKNED